MSEHVLGAGDDGRTASGSSAALSLTMLQARDQQEALSRLMERGRRWTDQMREEHPRRPPSEQAVELLDLITSEPEAEDSWRMVGDKVRAGVTTWTSVWLSEDYGRTGQELRLEVIHRVARSLDLSVVPGPETRGPARSGPETDPSPSR